MHRGTFTTKSNLKKLNRMLEFRLREAELLWSLASLQGKTYPAEELRSLYKKLLLNQFHDILPGSHIHPVYEDAMADYKTVGEALDRLIAEAAPAAQTWFNSLACGRDFITFIENEQGPDVRHGVKGFWCVPGMDGLTSGAVTPLEGCAGWLKQEADGTLATPYYRVKLNEDGSISSLYDLKLQREWVKTGRMLNKLHLYSDRPGNYDAWDILPNYKDVELPYRVVTPLRIVKSDDVCAVLEADLATEKSTWTIRLRLFADSRAIEVEHVVDWHEKHVLAKANFGVDVLTRELVCDTSAGYIRRELTKNTTWQQARFEVCHHKWADLSEGGSGLALINEGKYGMGLEGEEISLSLLRSTIRPDVTSDMGQHDFCYVILPHEGDFLQAHVNDVAMQYNVPLRQATVDFPAGLRQAIVDSGLVLQAMKRSEDGEKLVLRLSEQNGRRGTVVFPFPVQITNLLEDVEGVSDCVSYRPFELITVAVDPEVLK